MFASESEKQQRDIHAIGLTLKERGVDLKDKAMVAPGPEKVSYAVMAFGYLTAFTAYRAYRGFFVILPAVFVEVRAKLERREPNSLGVEDDIDPKTGKLKLRSTILMNLGAALFTTIIIFKSAVGALVDKITNNNNTSSSSSSS